MCVSVKELTPQIVW